MIKKLEQHEEFFPVFQEIMTQLMEILGMVNPLLVIHQLGTFEKKALITVLYT